MARLFYTEFDAMGAMDAAVNNAVYSHPENVASAGQQLGHDPKDLVKNDTVYSHPGNVASASQRLRHNSTKHKRHNSTKHKELSEADIDEMLLNYYPKPVTKKSTAEQSTVGIVYGDGWKPNFIRLLLLFSAVAPKGLFPQSDMQSNKYALETPVVHGGQGNGSDSRNRTFRSAGTAASVMTGTDRNPRVKKRSVRSAPSPLSTETEDVPGNSTLFMNETTLAAPLSVNETATPLRSTPSVFDTTVNDSSTTSMVKTGTTSTVSGATSSSRGLDTISTKEPDNSIDDSSDSDLQSLHYADLIIPLEQMSTRLHNLCVDELGRATSDLFPHENDEREQRVSDAMSLTLEGQVHWGASKMSEMGRCFYSADRRNCEAEPFNITQLTYDVMDCLAQLTDVLRVLPAAREKGPSTLTSPVAQQGMRDIRKGTQDIERSVDRILMYNEMDQFCLGADDVEQKRNQLASVSPALYTQLFFDIQRLCMELLVNARSLVDMLSLHGVDAVHGRPLQQENAWSCRESLADFQNARRSLSTTCSEVVGLEVVSLPYVVSSRISMPDFLDLIDRLKELIDRLARMFSDFNDFISWNDERGQSVHVAMPLTPEDRLDWGANKVSEVKGLLSEYGADGRNCSAGPLNITQFADDLMPLLTQLHGFLPVVRTIESDVLDRTGQRDLPRMQQVVRNMEDDIGDTMDMLRVVRINNGVLKLARGVRRLKKRIERLEARPKGRNRAGSLARIGNKCVALKDSLGIILRRLLLHAKHDASGRRIHPGFCKEELDAVVKLSDVLYPTCDPIDGGAGTYNRTGGTR